MQRRAALELLGAASRPARKATRISHQQRNTLGRPEIPAFVSYLPPTAEAGELDHAEPGSPMVPSPTACSSPEVPRSVRESREPLLQPLLSSPRALSEAAGHSHTARPLGLARNMSLRGENKWSGAVRALQQHSHLSGASDLSDLMSPITMLGVAGGGDRSTQPEAEGQQQQQQQQGKGLQSQWGFAPPASTGGEAKPFSPPRGPSNTSPSFRQSMLTSSLLRPPPAAAGSAVAAAADGTAGAAPAGDVALGREALDSADWPAEAAAVGHLGTSLGAESMIGGNSPLFPPTPEGVMAEVSLDKGTLASGRVAW
jgi:hypothetical protein